jgi:hypothetical protein
MTVSMPITITVSITITFTFTMTITAELSRFLKILKNQENFPSVARRHAIPAGFPPYIGGDYSGQSQSRIYSVF